MDGILILPDLFVWFLLPVHMGLFLNGYQDRITYYNCITVL